MGKPESGTPFDLCCKKFYQKFKEQENELSLTFIHGWGKTTDKPLLDQFWEYSIMECLTDEKIEKFEEKSLEVIGTSVIFLIEEFKDQSHSDFENLCNATCTIYRHLSTRLSKKINLTREEVSKEGCFYHIAKYSTLLKSYAEAWSYLTQCADLLDWNDEEELKWLNLLKEGYISHLKLQLLEGDKVNEFFKIAAKELFKIPGFLPTMNVQTTKVSDNLLDCETVNICLEGAKDFYQRNQGSEKRQETIRKLDASIYFPLACTAYRRAKGEKEEVAKNLLSVSQNCFSLLGERILDHDFMPFIDELLESLSQGDPRSVSPLQAEILTHMVKVAWSITAEEKAKEFYFEVAKVLYHTKPYLICPDWNVGILTLILDMALHSAPPAIWERMVYGISMNLVKAQYKSKVYLTVLKSYMEKEMWITASRLLERITKSTLILDNYEMMLQCLALKINSGFEKAQEDKRSLFKNFSWMIKLITAHKKKPNLKIDGLVENWIQSGLITKEQWLLLRNMNENNFNLMEGYLKEAGNEQKSDFLNLEFKAYADKIYDMFGLGESPLSSFKDVS
jgi:hypothetical protein